MLIRLIAFGFQLGAYALTELADGLKLDVPVYTSYFLAVFADAGPLSEASAGASAAKFESFQILFSFLLIP